jgi:hypothetical protein
MEAIGVLVKEIDRQFNYQLANLGHELCLSHLPNGLKPLTGHDSY